MQKKQLINVLKNNLHKEYAAFDKWNIRGFSPSDEDILEMKTIIDNCDDSYLSIYLSITDKNDGRMDTKGEALMWFGKARSMEALLNLPRASEWLECCELIYEVCAALDISDEVSLIKFIETIDRGLATGTASSVQDALDYSDLR